MELIFFSKVFALWLDFKAFCFNIFCCIFFYNQSTCDKPKKAKLLKLNQKELLLTKGQGL